MLECFRKRCVNIQWSASLGMRERYVGRMQQQSAATESFAKQPVVMAVAVIDVADDRVGNMVQMTSKLVGAAGQRQQFSH